MKMTVESTAKVAIANGLPLRLWRGQVADGTPIFALVALLGAADEAADTTSLERDLAALETETSPEVQSALRHVVGADRFGQCCAPHATARQRVEAAAALLCLDDPQHLLQALYDAGLHVSTDDPGVAFGEPWLTRDFLFLYRAAVATMSVNSLEDASRTRRALRAELERLAPAYRLLDVDGRDETTAQRVRAVAIADAIGEREQDARAGRLPVASMRLLHEAFVVALTRDRAIPETAHRCVRTSPPVPVAITRAIVDDARATGPAVDREGAGTFIAFAMRGAALGWHARHVHPGEVAAVGRAAEPLDEPHRSSFAFGFKLAVEHPGGDQ